MVDLGYLGELALQAWVNANPSPQWANRLIEPYRGLPFGTYLHATRPTRPRTLTGPLDGSGNSLWRKWQVLTALEDEQRTHEQAGCAFLSRLPVDIRLIIYEMVLGGMVLHLWAPTPKSRILHDVCQDPDGINEGSHHYCSDTTERPSSAPRDDEHAEATGLLPLLVTCRRIYSEAISTLYSANTFEFTQNFAAFTFLKLMVPPQRLQSIRSFRLHLRIPRHPALNSRTARDWRDLWDFFTTRMTGLKSLYLELQMLQPVEAFIESTSDDAAEDWIRPVIMMAVAADNRRGARLRLVTQGVCHEPAQIFKDVSQRHATVRREDVVRLACEDLHQRIRVSLRGHE